MSKITDKILTTIKTNHIEPKPRWHFIIRQGLIWLATVISIIVGSISFSMIIFKTVNNDWDFIKYLDKSPITHAFDTLPYIWILVLLLFAILAYYNAKHTKGAYKYHGYWLVGISILISLSLGGIFYGIGIAPKVHMASEKIPVFKDLMYDRHKIWMENEDKFLAGEVTEILSGVGIFQLTDFNDKEWVVRPASDYYPPPEKFILEEGVMLRLFGEKVDEDIFEASKVMPYEMGPGVEKGGHPGYKMNNRKNMHINYLMK